MKLFLNKRKIDRDPLKEHTEAISKAAERLVVLEHVIKCLVRTGWQERQVEMRNHNEGVFRPKLCVLVRVLTEIHDLSLEETELVCNTFYHYDKKEIADLYKKYVQKKD